MLSSTWGWMTSLSGTQPGLEEPISRSGDAGCTTSGAAFASHPRPGIPHGLSLGLGMPEGEEERALAAVCKELAGRWGGTAKEASEDNLPASMAARVNGDGAERECVRVNSMAPLNGSSGSSGSRDSGGRSSTSSRGHSSSSRSSNYAVDPYWLPWREEKHVVKTPMGEVTVTVWGDRCKPALITYHDVGLNHTTCFQGLFLCPDTAALLLDAFCVYHIDCPGHETGAEDLDLQLPAAPFLRVEDMAAQVGEVIEQLSLTRVTCLGVAAGAYVLLLLALARPELVERLILVSPILKAPTWAEWLHTKMLTSMLFFAGMCDAVKDALLHRFFCEDQSGFHGPGCDARIAFCMELEERQAGNVIRYLEAMQDRLDLAPLVSELHCDCLIAVGERSPFYSEAVELWELLEPASHCLPGSMLPPAVVAGKAASTRAVKIAGLDGMRSAGGPHGAEMKRTVGFVAVPACSSLVTEERPHTLIRPLEELLKLSLTSAAGNGMSPSSVLCASCNNSPSPSPSVMRRMLRTSSSSSTGGTLSSSSSFESRLSSADVADCVMAEQGMDHAKSMPGALPDWQLAGAVPGQSGIADLVTRRAYPHAHGHEHSNWASMMLHMMLPLRKSPPSAQDLSLRDAAASLKLRPIRTARPSSQSQGLHAGLHRAYPQQQQQYQPTKQAMQQLQDAAAMAAAALKQQRQAQDSKQQQQHHHWLLSFISSGTEGQAAAAGPARSLVL